MEKECKLESWNIHPLQIEWEEEDELPNVHELICGICKFLPVTPLWCNKCRQVLCKECSATTSPEPQIIPHIKPIPNHKFFYKYYCTICPGGCQGVSGSLPPKIALCLQALNFQCKYHNLGCYKICKYADLKLHEEICKFGGNEGQGELLKVEGWIDKKKPSFPRYWQKRYFVLDNRMLIYKHSQDAEVSGSLDFNMYKCHILRTDSILVILIEGNNKEFELRLENEEEARKWQKALNKHIDGSMGQRLNLTISTDEKFWKMSYTKVQHYSAFYSFAFSYYYINLVFFYI